MNEIEAFVQEQGARHPELLRRVQWPEVRAIATREGVTIRITPLARPARLVRYGRTWEIQINEDLNHAARAFYGTHELVHYWRDREDEPTHYAGEDWEHDPKEDFANMVAWYLTSTAREFYDRGSSTEDGPPLARP